MTTQAASNDQSDWAWLSRQPSWLLLDELPRVLGAKVPEMVQHAGLEMRTRDGRVALRARPGTQDLVYAEPLQLADGQLRFDARAVLERDALQEPADVQQWIDIDLQRAIDTGDLEVSAHGLVQAQLWANPSEVRETAARAPTK